MCVSLRLSANIYMSHSEGSDVRIVAFRVDSGVSSEDILHRRMVIFVSCASNTSLVTVWFWSP